MDDGDNKLVIKPRSPFGKTTAVSARLPNDVLNELEAIACKTGYNRSELIVMCIEYALKNLKIKGI